MPVSIHDRGARERAFSMVQPCRIILYHRSGPCSSQPSVTSHCLPLLVLPMVTMFILQIWQTILTRDLGLRISLVARDCISPAMEVELRL